MNVTPSRREFLCQTAALAALGAAALSPAHAAESSPRRNIVFILIDDMRFDAMGFMGHPLSLLRLTITGKTNPVLYCWVGQVAPGGLIPYNCGLVAR